jgi:serine/threonine-protein kinase
LAEAARTQQIQQFMLNLFNAGDKQTAPSDELRVVTLLDRGAQQARTLDRDPETQAELYQTLAGIYQNLGKFDRADPLLHSALERRQQVYGPQSSQVADSMTALGLLRLEQAKPDDAERLTREALALDQRLLSPTDPETSKAMSALGRVLVEKGSYAEAVPLLQNAIKLQSLRPEDQSALAVSLGQLATADYYQAKYDDADRLNQEALAIDKKQYGETNPRVADDYVDLGEIQHETGHEAEAEHYYRNALEIKKAWYGEQHPDTAFCMMALGQALIYEKRYDDAFPLVQRSVEIQEGIFGKSHPRVAMAYNQIGVLELKRGHFDAAEDYFSRMLHINQSIYGQRHMLVGASILNLAEVYLEHKQYARAEASFRDAIHVFLQTLPADHPYIAISDAKLGATLVLDRKYKEAEAPLVEGYQLLGKQTKELNDRLGGSARKDLATVYEHLGEQDKLAALTAKPGPSNAGQTASH